jgi:hypothetical protein
MPHIIIFIAGLVIGGAIVWWRCSQCKAANGQKSGGGPGEEQ